ncbi:MAG: hypothetical protein KF730_16465 [Sphingomonas sp.]|uniref:hypothetical protein n=1 Tax=Sphingomonas sp. TaxID=28214 RepID=UPI0025FE7915|nr:hypothetical protein [Sphingomonas sp.]MBX3566154.1 hypothetical protein [Sphingomonas sp.]
MKFTGTLLAAALCAASPALAQTAAKKDYQGHLYCMANTVDLRETGDGRYKADIAFEHRGDPEHAVYPAGGTKLFGPQSDLHAYLGINYEFFLDATGAPAGRAHIARISLSTGRFAGARLAPFESLALQLQAGSMLSKPVRLNSGFYDLALIGGEAGQPGSSNPYDSEWPQDELDALVTAFDNGEGALVLTQSGKEVARIPILRSDVVPQRDRDIAWVRTAAPLLIKGKCPA